VSPACGSSRITRDVFPANRHVGASRRGNGGRMEQRRFRPTTRPYLSWASPIAVAVWSPCGLELGPRRVTDTEVSKKLFWFRHALNLAGTLLKWVGVNDLGRTILSLVGLGALVLAGVAQAAASPVSPAPGAVVQSSHPVFTWTVPPNEESQTIHVATAPQTTPEGRFFSENVIESDFFLTDVRQWAPTSALYAGTYWWIVGTQDRDSFLSRFSAPSEFRIPATVRIASVRLRRNSYTYVPDDLDITVRWSTNARQATVSAAVSRAGRRLWRARETESASVGSTQTTFFDWTKPRRIRQGTPLRVTITVRAGTATTTVARTVRAP
jgi:hypothetical protein